MSNPAVVELKNGAMSIGGYRLEDNIGESIHLHIGDWRFDMTVAELEELSKKSEGILDSFLNIEGFSCRDVDPLFLSQISAFLPDLVEVRKEKIKLSQLQVYKWVGFLLFLKNINASKVYKAYRGDTKADDKYVQINKTGESNKDRRDKMLESIKTNGYPYENKYIILFNDQNIIRDGQHRAAALYYLYGDKEVEVLRFIFADNKHSVSWKSVFKRIKIREVKAAMKKTAKKGIRTYKALKKKCFMALHKGKLREYM
jgi:hypothetical protein